MKKPLILTVVIILLIGGAAFAWWTISPLFIKTTLNEDIPVNAGILTEETTAPANPVNNEEQPMTENEDNELLTTITGEFIDGEHKVSGTVKIVYSDGTKYLRFENFSTENGPDLRVYLAGDTTAKDFVDLGELPATEGNYNIQLPDSIDLTTHDTVLIWCRAFRVNFGSAELTEK
jgi:hypothetical protein